MAGHAGDVFVDDGITAARSDVLRPGFQRLREWLAEGRVAQLWCSERSRLTRTNLGWFAFAEELEAAGITTLHTRRRGVQPVRDLGTDAEAVVDTDEVRRLRERVNDKLDRLAEQGRPSGGRTFGYRNVVDDEGHKNLEVVAEQAEIIRQVARDILDGVAKSTIAKRLQREGVRGAAGGEVGASTVGSWVTNPTVAGLRAHRGELARDANGELVRGTWDPILDEGTWQAVRAKLTASAARGERPTRRKYLLSGIVVCECERRMVGNWRTGKGRKPGAGYLCKACGCSIRAKDADEYVADELLARLDDLAAALADNETETRRQDILGELGTFADRRAAAGRMFATGDMDEDGYKAAKQELDARQAALSAQLGELPTRDDTVDVAAIRHAWQYNTLDERRDVIATFVDRVVIDRAQPGAPRKINLDRVHIEGPGWD